MPLGEHEVWITGLGLISSLGDGWQAHMRALANHRREPVIEEKRFAPCVVHPLCDVDFSGLIPKRTDRNQMGRWQLIGVHAAGLALKDAGVAGQAALLDRTDLCVAAGNGERDIATDARILATVSEHREPERALATILPLELRPTLYLGQLSNLLAGNISIVHKTTGSSRTFKGEEMAGVSAIEDAVQRIRYGERDLFLVGGALNAEREDLLLGYEIDGALWHGGHRSVWARTGLGGMCPGSMGAFLVLERRVHAEARGARPYARIASVLSDRCDRSPGMATQQGLGFCEALAMQADGKPLPVFSGASGVEPILTEERNFLQEIGSRGCLPVVRAYGSLIGHGVEAHFPAGMALAALAVSGLTQLAAFDAMENERTINETPERALVTAFGHWRGEALALVEAVL